MGPGFLRRWIIVVTVGEWLGFAAPALVGALLGAEEAVILVPALLAAGAVEGALLGAAQWLALRTELPGLPVRRWVGFTVLGAVVAYLLGLLPSTLWDPLSQWPVGAQVVFLVVVGSALLATIGTAQWVELRRHVPRAWRWIAGTAAAWGVALAVFAVISTPLWQEGQSTLVRVGIGVFAGAVMAATMAAVTGLVMRALLEMRSATGWRRDSDSA